MRGNVSGLNRAKSLDRANPRASAKHPVAAETANADHESPRTNPNLTGQVH